MDNEDIKIVLKIQNLNNYDINYIEYLICNTLVEKGIGFEISDEDSKGIYCTKIKTQYK